jgi:hypothetical protein
VPDIDQLLAHLDQQRHAAPEVLLVQARTAMANDAQEVLAAVRVFFGDEAAGGTAVEISG